MDSHTLRGHTDMLILSALAEGRKHGYAITQYLTHSFDEEFSFSAGMLYPMLHALEAKKLIKGLWHLNGKRRRKEYELTPAGRKMLTARKSDWRLFLKYMHAVLGA